MPFFFSLSLSPFISYQHTIMIPYIGECMSHFYDNLITLFFMFVFLDMTFFSTFYDLFCYIHVESHDYNLTIGLKQ